MTELKPCPFCGGTRIHTASPMGRVTMVCCDDCGATVSFYRSESFFKAVRAWNMRGFRWTSAKSGA